MIQLIEALNYRCLRHVRQQLGRFQLLVGPNASGKTTFLDVVDFLGDLVSSGLEEAISKRTQSWPDLVWERKPQRFELAIELEVPKELRSKLERPEYCVARYEVSIGAEGEDEELGILAEKLLLKEPDEVPHRRVQRSLFPEVRTVPPTIITPTSAQRKKTVVNKVAGGNDNFYDETGSGWDHAFKLGPRKCTLANLPEDESRFPASTWVKGILSDGIQRLMLNSLRMREPSPPGQPRRFLPNGSNLPWVVNRLREKEKRKHRQWVSHVQTALPDIEDVDTVLRDEDRNRYLRLDYSGGLKVPSWTSSDGTLRLLALTLPAYLPDLQGIFLVEEPENGIHPRALETVYQSLASVYGAQVLVATHSPILVALAKPSNILCFAKTSEGSTDIVGGPDHPKLTGWQKETSLGDLFAAGVLG